MRWRQRNDHEPLYLAALRQGELAKSHLSGLVRRKSDRELVKKRTRGEEVGTTCEQHLPEVFQRKGTENIVFLFSNWHLFII